MVIAFFPQSAIQNISSNTSNPSQGVTPPVTPPPPVAINWVNGANNMINGANNLVFDKGV